MITRVYDPAWLSTLPARRHASPLAHRYAMIPGVEYDAMRDQIDRIVATVPDLRKRRELIQALRAREDSTVRGALGEVLVGGALAAVGLDVEWNPNINGQTPDFRMSRPGHAPVVVETATVTAGGHTDRIEYSTARVRDALEKLQTVHSLSLHGPILVPATASLKPFVAHVRRNLDVLDQEGRGGARPRRSLRDRTYVFTAGDYVVRYSVLPYLFNEPVTCSPGGHSVGVGQPGKEQIEAALDAKASAYRFPIVIACLVEYAVTFGLHTIEDALFGSESICHQINARTGEPVGDWYSKRSSNGFLRERAGLFQRNRRIQAVIGARMLGIQGGKGIPLEVRVYPNPFATDPIPDEMWGDVSRTRVVQGPEADTGVIEGLDEPGTPVYP